MKNLGLYKDNLDISRKQDIDVVASRVSTNEDNIAMLDSDMETAQSDILTLKTNVTEVTNALTSKQDKIVGGASTITDDNLIANRALVSNSSGKVAVSAVTSTELGYLDGVTSNVQTQLDSKLSEAPVQSVNSKTGAVTLTKADIGLGNVDNVKQYSANNPPPYPVTSVNKKTGAVVLDASDVNAVAKTGDSMTGTLRVGSASLETNGYVTGTWLKTTANTALSTNPSKIAVINDGWIYSRTPKQIKNDIGLSNVDNVKQYSASNPPPYPVTSVNGQTGAVTIDIPDSKSYYNKKYSGTLETSGWVKQSDSLYYKQVTITGMTSSQYPIVMPVWTNNRTNEQSAWNSLNAEVESFDGYVRFYAKTPITTAVGFVLLFGNV